jgi:hypothetical protein
VISQALRDSSSETKIAPRSVRIAALRRPGGVFRHRRLHSGWVGNLTLRSGFRCQKALPQRPPEALSSRPYPSTPEGEQAATVPQPSFGSEVERLSYPALGMAGEAGEVADGPQVNA